MARPFPFRSGSGLLRLSALVFGLAFCPHALSQTTPPATPGAVPAHPKVRAAEDAYLAGAKKLEHDELDAAEHQFDLALRLDPANPDYAIALTVARQHKLTELVQQAGKARLAGNGERAETLLAEARAIDPENPIILQHGGPHMAMQAVPSQGRVQSTAEPGTPLADRAQMLAAPEGRDPRPAVPVFAGALRLKPKNAVQSFHTREDTQDLLRDVAAAYGIRAVFDEPLDRRSLRFDLGEQPYENAMPILMKMVHVFAVPIDETSILIARDTEANRQRLNRQLQETIYLPGMTIEQVNDIANVIRNVFEVKQATVETTLQSIVVRAPAEIMGPMNATLEDLLAGSGEVMLEVKLYEVDKTHTRDLGGTIPTQGGVYNVDAAATALVNANQSLVQQAIAQGLGNPPLTASSSNLLIAAELIASGLVTSSLLSSTVGIFGNGITTTGITETGAVAFSLSLNSSDTRALDDVQMQVLDRQPATFRAGTKYPVTTSTYSTGLSTAASALSGATINGVSVASLLAQYAGGSSTTIPQVTYEDLGVTLKATPTMQKTGRIYLKLDMKIEALAGGMANGIPVLANRQFTSDITVGDGESVMMVSSVNRSESSAVTGIPGLSELPGFQAPLDQNAERDTGQLVVMVTPHVVRRRSDMVIGPQIVVHAQEAAGPVN